MFPDFKELTLVQVSEGTKESQNLQISTHLGVALPLALIPWHI